MRTCGASRRWLPCPHLGHSPGRDAHRFACLVRPMPEQRGMQGPENDHQITDRRPVLDV